MNRRNRSISILLGGAILFVPALSPAAVSADREDLSVPFNSETIDSHITQHAQSYEAEERGEREVGHIDLEGDDMLEVAVLYNLAKHNDTFVYLAIFEQDGDSLRLVDQVYLGGRGLRHVVSFAAAEDNIEIEAMEFQGDDPLSSPSLRVTIGITVRYGLLHIERTVSDE